MRTLFIIALALTLTACGGNAPVAADGLPDWELRKVVPTAANEEIFTATVDGHSGMVEGIGPDHESRIYDACAYIASTAKPGSSLYRAMLSSFGAVVYIAPARTCNIKQQASGLFIDVI